MSWYSNLRRLVDHTEEILALVNGDREPPTDDELDARIDARIEAYDFSHEHDVSGGYGDLYGEGGYGGPEDLLADLEGIHDHISDLNERVMALEQSGVGEMDREELQILILEILDAYLGGDDDIDVPLPARYVGPKIPTGEYHQTPGWGIHLDSSADFEITGAMVEAVKTGVVTAELYNFRAGEAGDLVDYSEFSIPVAEEAVEIDLDLKAPAGEYLLTRDYTHDKGEDIVDLRRGSWDGWDSHGVPWLTLYGGNSIDWGTNTMWYNFQNLEVRRQ